MYEHNILTQAHVHMCLQPCIVKCTCSHVSTTMHRIMHMFTCIYNHASYNVDGDAGTHIHTHPPCAWIQGNDMHDVRCEVHVFLAHSCLCVLCVHYDTDTVYNMIHTMHGCRECIYMSPNNIQMLCIYNICITYNMRSA
jgi:hypothetical protein